MLRELLDWSAISVCKGTAITIIVYESTRTSFMIDNRVS